jgi:glycosyl transferase family 25
MQIFVINLDRSEDRLAFMREQTERLGLSFERVSAVNGLDVPPWLASEFKDASGSLFPGEVGCFASHLLAAKEIVSRDLEDAIILEDDALLPSDFIPIVQTAVEAAPPGWDVIHLCSLFKKSVVSIAELQSGRRLVRFTQWPASTVAYVLSNRGARKVLSPHTRTLPVDMERRFAWRLGLNIVGVYPAPIRQKGTFAGTVREGTRAGKPWAAGPLSLLYGAVWTARQVGATAYLKGMTWNYVNSIRKCFGRPYPAAVIDAHIRLTDNGQIRPALYKAPPVQAAAP